MRVGYLFNHAAAHQVAHSLPVAMAMARRHPGIEVSLHVTGGPAEAEVRRLWTLAGHSADDPRIERLRPASPLSRTVAGASGNAFPIDRISILARNLDRFSQLDALVVPEKTSTLLKSRFGLTVPLIHTRHGAGDRAIGFDAASARFDLVLLSGAKIRDRLADAGLLQPDGFAIVGYPKFDADVGPHRPLFDNGRPTVIYNPHPSPGLSSWYRFGPKIVEWFANQDRFNLILAPHVMLFERRWTVALSPFSVARVPDVALREVPPHVRIDKGSRSSVDMTYTDSADIYLGDASSQVYEFIRRPRPCVFFDGHGVDWQGDPDFTHWQAGDVVRSIEDMATALDRCTSEPQRYEAVQRQLFAYSFDIGPRPSAERAAAAIVEWLDRRAGEAKEAA